MAGELNLGSLIYELGFEDEQAFLRALDRTLDRAEDRSERSGREAGQGFSRGMSRFIGSAALGGLIGGATAQAFGMASAAVGDFVRNLDQRAVQIQASMRKATVVFGETLPTVQAWAQENANALGLTTQQAVALAAGAQDLLVPMGFVREEAVDISTQLIGLSGALAEWSGGQRTSAEVADTLTAALLGERDALTGLGISISAADVEARLAAKGQAELEGAVRQQAEAQATLELILEKSTDAQRAFADGADEPIRKMQLQKAAIQESKDALALDLIPVMQTYYEDVAPTLVEWTGQAVTVFGQFMQGLTNAKDLDPADYTFFTRLGEMFRGIGDAIGYATERLNGLYAASTGRVDAFDLSSVTDDQAEQIRAQIDERISFLEGEVQAYEERIDKTLSNPKFLGFEIIPGQENRERAVADDKAQLEGINAELAELRGQLDDLENRNVTVASLPLLNTAAPSGSTPNSSTGTPSTNTPTRTSSAGASAKAEKTFVQQEVEAIRLEGQRLKEVRGANLISAERYEREIDGHYRRLMGLVDQAATSQEQIDVLRLANSFSDELGRIAEDHAAWAEGIQRRNQEMQEAVQRSATENAQRVAQEREETAERNDDLNRQQYQMQQGLERRVSEAAARTAREREAARVERLRGAEAEVRFLAQLEDRTASEQADALQRILDKSELNAEERVRLEQEVALLRKRAADEAADAIIAANQREAREIEADTRRARAQYRQRQDLEVEALRLSGQAREADLAAAKNALDRALEEVQGDLELRDALTEAHRLRALDINARYDEQELEAERRRIQTIIQGEGELSEAKRVALIAQLTQELEVLRSSEEANVARITAIQEALGTLSGQKGVDLTKLEGDLTNVALSFPRALVSGIRENNVEGALKGALGSATDFFVERMIQGIVGDIAASLAASIAKSTVSSAAGNAAGAAAGAASLGPAGIIIGGALLGVSLLGGLLGSKPKPQRSSATSGGSGSPSITYQASTTLNFALGADLKDPAILAEVRALAREETLAVLEQLGRLKK